MFDKNLDGNNLSVSIGGDLDSTSSGGTSSDHSAVHQDNLSSPMAYGSLFLPNAGESAIRYMQPSDPTRSSLIGANSPETEDPGYHVSGQRRQ